MATTESGTAVRERTHTWRDPMESAARAREMAGLDFLRALTRGEIPAPPIMGTVGYGDAEFDEGRAVFHLEPAEHHYNPIGVVHGGVAATLLDTAAACAVHTLLPAGSGYTTLELKVSYLRAITRDTGRLRCEGSVLHVGGRTALAEAKLVDAAGKLYAHATSTCMIFRP